MSKKFQGEICELFWKDSEPQSAIDFKELFIVAG